MNGIITLTTDFGLYDEYVGVMKGVILSGFPEAVCVDITHGIAPQNIQQAGFTLLASYGFFPAGTLHLVVVDPGVGSHRRIVLCHAADQYFLVPDNGILSPILAKEPVAYIRCVTCSGIFLKPVSHTFHGRDIFAPVAGALLAGMKVEDVGPIVARDSLVDFFLPVVEIDEERGIIQGEVLHIDYFGNLVTNIHKDDLDRIGLPETGREVRILAGNAIVAGIQTAYSERATGSLVAILSSRGFLEIAIRCGNAAEKLAAGVREKVVVRIKK